MYLTEETIRAVLVAAIQANGTGAEIDQLIKATVGALMGADRELRGNTRQEAIDKVNQALKAARLAMCATNNTLTTDRPDLPRSEETSWTIDFNKEISLIDQGIQALSSTDSDHE